MKIMLIGVGLALTVCAACSSSGGSADYPNDHLTGFGATRDTWNAHHDANSDPDLDKGCCYGPQVSAPDNGGTADTWNLAASSGDIVNNITHTFAPNTSQFEAQSEVEASDLPKDAVVATTGSQAGCTTVIYTSASMGKAAPRDVLGRSISVTFYSPIASPRYNANNVVQAIETPDDDPNVAC